MPLRLFYSSPLCVRSEQSADGMCARGKINKRAAGKSENPGARIAQERDAKRRRRRKTEPHKVIHGRARMLAKREARARELRAQVFVRWFDLVLL